LLLKIQGQESGTSGREPAWPAWDLLFFFFAVLGLVLRAFAFSHSTSSIFVKDFSRQGLAELLAQASFKP
jgi:hypothetical protein